jgi:hypothetical protein
MVGFQERLDEFMLVGGSLSKLKFPRTVVQTIGMNQPVVFGEGH